MAQPPYPNIDIGVVPVMIELERLNDTPQAVVRQVRKDSPAYSRQEPFEAWRSTKVRVQGDMEILPKSK